MKIMKWVSVQIENKNWGYYLVLALLSIFALYLAFGKIVTDICPLSEKMTKITWDKRSFWYFPWAVAMIGIVYVWMYYAPVVCRDLDRLGDAFPNEEYRALYYDFTGWLRQLYWNRSGKSLFLKILYTIFWFLFLGCFIYSYCTIFSQNFQHKDSFFYYGCGAFLILSTVIIILNYSSYYICMMFVYFLIRICKLDKNSPLDYLKQSPSATGGFQLLKHTANRICLYFFLDCFFCMISLYCFWQIINIDNIIMTKTLWAAFFYATFFFMTLCLISWVVIILVSRTYLHRLHNEWKFRSIKEYKECTAVMEKLAMDRISVGPLELMISIATLVANIVTAWAILSPWLELF